MASDGRTLHIEIWEPDGEEAHLPTLFVSTMLPDSGDSAPVYVISRSSEAVAELLAHRDADGRPDEEYYRLLEELIR